MKKLLLSIGAFILLTTLSSQAAVYVNFTGSRVGGGNASGDPFGVTTSQWVNASGATNADGINAAGTIVTWSSPNTWGDDQNGNEGDETVYGGYLDDGGNSGNFASFTVSGLTAALGGKNYNITVYHFSDNPSNGIGEFTSTAGTPTTIQEASTGALTGNYGTSTISNVSGDSFTFSGVSGSSGRETISGFTVVAVPEPSSVILLGLGGFALILRRRK